MLALSILLLPSVVGCEDYYDTDGEVVQACEGQHIDRLRPRDDSDDAFVDGHVFVSLACPVSHGVLTLRTLQGETATGLVNLHHEGHQVRFRPSPRLHTRTAYDAHLDTSAGFHDWRFVTSALGEPAGDELAGTALLLHPGTGTLMDPPGLDEVLTPSLEGFHPALQFMADPAGSSVLARLGGVAVELEGDPQDPSKPVLDLSSTWDDPFWRFGPFDLEWELDGFVLVVRDAVFSGAMASDLSGGGGVALNGTWDVRLAEPALGSVCELVAEAGGGPCQPCDDGVDACLALALVQASADPWYGVLEAP
jgi:hypothetical protein